MTFGQAVNRTPSIRRQLKPGLTALNRADRSRIKCDGKCLCGSVDPDSALRDIFPNDARWDYAVGVTRQQDSVVWVEAHSASSLHVDEVLNKLKWLHWWLDANASELNRLPRLFCWVATGSVSLHPGSPQARR